MRDHYGCDLWQKTIMVKRKKLETLVNYYENPYQAGLTNPSEWHTNRKRRISGSHIVIDMKLMTWLQVKKTIFLCNFIMFSMNE